MICFERSFLCSIHYLICLYSNLFKFKIANRTGKIIEYYTKSFSLILSIVVKIRNETRQYLKTKGQTWIKTSFSRTCYASNVNYASWLVEINDLCKYLIINRDLKPTLNIPQKLFKSRIEIMSLANTFRLPFFTSVARGSYILLHHSKSSIIRTG